MKKIIILIISFIILIGGTIITIVLVKEPNENSDKMELCVCSYDNRVTLSFGYQDVYDKQINSNNRGVTYRCNDVENIKKIVDDFEGHVIVNGKNLLYYDGYYFSYGFYNDMILFGCSVDVVRGIYFIPSILGYYVTNNLFEIPKEKLESHDYIRFKEYTYCEYDWSVLDKSEIVFKINKKEDMINYFESLNDRVAYYSLEDDCIYINAYQFRGWAPGDKSTTDYPFIIKFLDDGFGAGYKFNPEE